jgi:hypothetical protein
MEPERLLTPETVMNALAHHGDPHVRECAKYLIKRNDQNKRIMKTVQEVLSQLRVDMKYLVFDLEATRRERDELKRKLEQ